MKHMYAGRIEGHSRGMDILGGLLLVLAAGFLLYTCLITHQPGKGIFWGVPLTITALGITWKRGTRIDFDQRHYQEYRGFFAFRFGHWEPLPPVTRLVLTEVTQRTLSNSRYQWTTTVRTQISYRITLCNPHTDFRLVVSEGADRKSALREAQALSRKLRVPLEIDA